MVREITPGVFLITQRKRTRFAPFSVNVFVLAGESGLVFDAGLGGRKAGDELARKIREIEETVRARGEACRITRVLPSHGHWDHFSGIEGLRKRLGLQVLATPRMKPSMVSKAVYRDGFRTTPEPAPLIRRWARSLGHALLDTLFFTLYHVTFVSGPMDMIDERAVLEIKGETWELMPMPGHCDDDVVLFNRKQGVLLCGDIVLRAVNTWIGPPRSDLKRYLETLDQLMALPGLTLLLPAHGSPIPDPYTRLKAAAEHRRARTEDVYTMIKNAGDGGIGFEEMFKIVYPSLAFKERFLARGWIQLTIDYLMNEKRVGSRTVKRRTTFYAYEKNRV